MRLLRLILTFALLVALAAIVLLVAESTHGEEADAPVASTPPPPGQAGGATPGGPAIVADPLEAPTFFGLYAWKQVVWQSKPGHADIWSLEKGDVWGGRLVVGVGLGHFGLELRGDVAGLKDQFKVDDTTTYQSIEVYGDAYYNLWGAKGAQVGPMVTLGTVAAVDGPGQYGGIGLALVGAGVRIGALGGETHLFVGRTDFLYNDPGWHLGMAFHFPVMPPVYVVADVLTGQDGLIRVGIAARLK